VINYNKWKRINIDFDGALADLYNRLQRAIQRCCLEAGNEYRWEIPFTQLTPHQPEPAS